MAYLWLEAEAFENLGGWVIDQQSTEQMGSAYIMAHGLGRPVADATTRCVLPESGEWTVWVRTRNWTAAWGRGTPAGRFHLLLNDAPLPVELGTNGSSWGWQKVGVIVLEEGDLRVALHDLTGFNGRCDAIYFTTDPNEIPPEDGPELEDFRRQRSGSVIQDDPFFYDLAIAGGGMAGVCAAIAAIRTGSRVVLIQDRPVLGGCNSSEIRVPLGGFAHAEPYPNLGRVVTEIEPIYGKPGILPAEMYEDVRKANVFALQKEETYHLALNERVIAVERADDDPRTITAFITRNARMGIETRYRARCFADCTGDAVIARMMGAETMYGTESRSAFDESLAPEKGSNQVMGMSVLWHSVESDEATQFPDIDWGIPFTEDNAYYVRSGDWEWEMGQYRDQATDAEYIRDYGLMTLFANWSYLKNHSKRKSEWACSSLAWATAVGGKRESYRVVGDHILTQKDIEDQIEYPDATGAMTWNLDLHFPDPENEEKFDEPFRSCAYHRGLAAAYPVPYRCLYARVVKNLFLGGRHISATHVAFSCVRVMRTLGILGEVIGMAASLCARENALPRDIYDTHFEALRVMMEAGVPRPTYHAYRCSPSESYHFKDTGHLNLDPNSPDVERLKDPALQHRIKALKVRHQRPHPVLDGPEAE